MYQESLTPKIGGSTMTPRGDLVILSLSECLCSVEGGETLSAPHVLVTAF